MQFKITCAITGPHKLPGVHAQVHALAHFPSLERERERTVPAVDALGGRYRLRFRYWVNNQSRMYVLEGCQPPDVRAYAVPLSRGLCPEKGLTALSKGAACMPCMTASRRAYKLLPLFRLSATCGLLCGCAASSLGPYRFDCARQSTTKQCKRLCCLT